MVANPLQNPSSIPTTVRIGVTGHRLLEDEDRLRAGVREVLARIDALLGLTPHTFVLVSPLAEGADRLAADEVLNWPVGAGMTQPALEVPLPLPEADYRQDFHTPASQQEFSNLLKRSTRTTTLSETISRTAAYEQVGHTVVQNCEVLLAIWDGKPAAGLGGTADIVAYARRVERTLFWIHSETGEVILEEHKDNNLQALRCLDTYNREQVKADDVQRAARAEFALLASQAEKSGLDSSLLGPVVEDLIPHYARADLLATRYQKRHLDSGSAIYILAAAAVATVTFQKLFLPELTQLLLVEAVIMVTILLLLYLAYRGDWHRKWIDYRFLAERLRSAFFLFPAGIDCMAASSLTDNFTHQPQEWMVRAFTYLWGSCEQVQPRGEVFFNALKAFVLDAWLRDQVSWFRRKGERHHQRHVFEVRAGIVIFGLTIVAVAAHALTIGVTLPQWSFPLSDAMTAFAIVLPAAGAALAGIRVHHEYERNAERYARIVPILEMIIEQIVTAQNNATMTALLTKANEVLLVENQDWRVTFLYQKVEPP